MNLLEIPPLHSLYAMLGLLALLSLATIIILVLKKRSPHKNYTELVLRIRTWWVIFIFFSLMIFGTKYVSMLAVAFICFLALKEYFSLVSKDEVDSRVRLWAYLSIPGQFYFIYISWFSLFLLFIPFYWFLFLPFRMILAGQTKNYLHRISTIQWGLLLNVFSLSHLAYLQNLGSEINPNAGVGGLIIFVVALTQLNDVFQFCWGKLIGGKKIVPSVSPNKTWAGFIGGACSTAALSALIAPYLTTITFGHSIILGLLLAIAGFIGDVNISALKRDIGVKDSGTALPGHGGILDRVDSLSYTAPLFFHYIRYFF